MRRKSNNMKQTIFLLFAVAMLAVLAAASCTGSGATGNRSADSLSMMKDSGNYTTVSFPDSLQNFGTVEHGKQMKILFHVKNTGAKPLLIADARPSCGCTVADFTKSPIAPGKDGEINASFDSNHGMPGQVRKTITITTNTSPQHTTLIFTGEVMPKPDSTTTK